MEAFADREEKADACRGDSDEDDDIDYFGELSSDEDDPDEKVYEQQFLEKQKIVDDDAPPKENPAHVEIRTAMRDLFTKLDALSNFHMMPRPVLVEVKVVSNLPSLSVEVTPVGVSAASLLAPTEVKTKPKGEMVAKGERTHTQKLRGRRLKKALQKRRTTKAANKAGKVTEDKKKVIKATNTELAKTVKGTKSAKGAKAAKPHNSPEKTLSHEQLTLKPVPDGNAKEILLKWQTKAIRDVREELLESRSSAKTIGDNKGL
ncbi:hypothetical protein HPB49_012435 [Dermacentor silvarum]|uniref:Uncharacterized protein n=1 Tax=Dermacentor silvarum TaxID=543639 RepID=A0ACB8DZL8_DERSI|nr:hypothetical protein HPB49_012435 [Dermacentor silvarum]